MKRNIYLFFTLLMLNCQKAADKTEKTEAVQKIENSETKKDLTEEANLDCEGFFKKIVLSSNLTALKSYKETFIRIESVSEEKIVLEVYVKNNIAETSKAKHITENTIAWLHYLPNEEKLLDITSDPEEPMVLSFGTGVKQLVRSNQHNLQHSSLLVGER